MPKLSRNLTAMSYYGCLVQGSGSLGRRAAKFEDVLRRKEEAFSDEHTYVLQSRSSLAHMWARQGRLAEAVEMHRNVLKTMKLQFGDAHPDTLTAMTDLAETLRWTGETVEAASWRGMGRWLWITVSDPTAKSLASGWESRAAYWAVRCWQPSDGCYGCLRG
ncbi:hypothetical protein CMUS01_13740 [Colletotrichum musicola]|uniref:Kinesin light chain n=1 Tax=Colletotrichum musicola TaxID=2175873 RepID=A0A8H6JAS3_9PEZI|nr:hypothetical protein CMUS01_13740 [Colletotrichum musicola]